MKVALTGHRTEFFPEGDKSFVPRIEGAFKKFLKTIKPELVISGGCYGFDLIGARECHFNKTPFDLYLPFPEFGVNWELDNREFLEGIKPKSRSIKNISEKYHKDCFYKRDKAMVDACDIVISLLHPEATKGGTFYTAKYSEKTGKEVYNIWPNEDDKLYDLIENHKLFREDVY